MVDTSKTDHILSVAGNIWKAAPPSVYWDMEINGVEFEDAVKNWERDNLGDVIDTDDYFEYEYPDPFNPHEEIPGVSPEEARNLDYIIDDEENFLESLISSIFGTDEEEDDTQQIVATPMPTYEEMPIDWEDGSHEPSLIDT